MAKRRNQAFRYGRAVRQGSTTPSIILADSQEQMRQVHAHLLEAVAEPDSMMRGFVTIETFLPSDLEARHAVLQEISEDINRRAYNRIRGDARRMLRELRRLVDVEMFDETALPDWAIRMLSEMDGTFGEIGLLFGDIQKWNVLEVQAFADRYAQIEVESGTVHVASSAFITADVIDTVQADGRRVAWLVLVVVFIVLVVSTRSVTGALISVVAIVAAVVMTGALMALTDTRLGIYNIVVLPTVVGISIDGAIHLYLRAREEGAARFGRAMRTTGLAVAAATVTDASGFHRPALSEPPRDSIHRRARSDRPRHDAGRADLAHARVDPHRAKRSRSAPSPMARSGVWLSPRRLRSSSSSRQL